jgi:arylsulfatase A-like enzyme
MSESRRPNILLITSDQQHYSTLGAVNPKIKTPALDRLCRQGTRFDRAYCPNPTCTPTRASIITGMYPSQHGAWSLGTKLMEDVPTLGDMLGTAGYYTALVGKAHFQPLASEPGYESIECQPTLRDLDFWRRFQGPWYGFQHVETARMHGNESHAGQHYALWMEEKGLTNWRDYFQPWPPKEDDSGKPYYEKGQLHWDLPEEYHYSVWTAERTVDHIGRAVEADQPFFAWASFHDPHPPYTVPEPWASMYDPAEMDPGRLTEGEHDANPPHFAEALKLDAKMRDIFPPSDGAIHGGHSHAHDLEQLKKNMAIYYGMTSFMDAQIGRILDRLDELGQADNTIIVFTTDHGHFLGQHGLTAKAIHHYEDLLRVPFIVRWPGQAVPDAVSENIQNLVDLAPTFLKAAGLEVPGSMTGVDQRATWAGGDAVRTWSVTENHHGTDVCHLRTYVNQRYKITVYKKWDDGELFDLQEDPGEVRNLWNDPDSRELKAKLLLEFMQATLSSEPMRMPRIAGA